MFDITWIMYSSNLHFLCVLSIHVKVFSKNLTTSEFEIGKFSWIPNVFPPKNRSDTFHLVQQQYKYKTNHLSWYLIFRTISMEFEYIKIILIDNNSIKYVPFIFMVWNKGLAKYQWIQMRNALYVNFLFSFHFKM